LTIPINFSLAASRYDLKTVRAKPGSKATDRAAERLGFISCQQPKVIPGWYGIETVASKVGSEREYISLVRWGVRMRT
jgi:hypothetical protein